MTDAIDTLAGVAPGSFLDTLRRQKPITRDNAQASFDALFKPADLADMTTLERGAVALFIAVLHQDQAAIAFYRPMAADLATAIEGAAGQGATTGPYGHYPAGPLSAEDQPGPTFTFAADLGPRLSAALAHTHMLVFHLRDAAPAHLRALEAAGWSATGIVTLSQLVAFLSFQLRAAHGLRALAASHR